MTLLLPDVSEFQPGTDMAGIRRQNGGAAIIRAAYGDAHPDKVFARLRAAASDFGFLGIYHYVVAGQDIGSQASAFCGIVGELAPHEVPIIDIEEGDGSQLSRTMDWASLIADRLSATCWIYSGESFALAHGLAPLFSGTTHHTWIAAYGSTEPALGHTLWQSTDGSIGSNITSWPGAGRCDTSVFHGTLAELAALTTPGADMALTQADAELVAKAVWTIDGIIPAPDGNPANTHWEPQRALSDLGVQARALEASIKALLSGLAGFNGSPQEVADAIATTLGPELGQQVVDALSARLAAPAPS
jgi:GH25 family lysozyme M1 (1,4-beta-N-acetylmuramidase)